MATGRNVAIRMAVVAVVWLVLGGLLALVFSDPLFVFFGVVGAFGAGLSSVIAVVGADTGGAASAEAQQSEDDGGRPSASNG